MKNAGGVKRKRLSVVKRDEPNLSASDLDVRFCSSAARGLLLDMEAKSLLPSGTFCCLSRHGETRSGFTILPALWRAVQGSARSQVFHASPWGQQLHEQPQCGGSGAPGAAPVPAHPACSPGDLTPHPRLLAGSTAALPGQRMQLWRIRFPLKCRQHPTAAGSVPLLVYLTRLCW